jgi:divalent metal cation (Fe/Co/Zn/Cd) transporter
MLLSLSAPIVTGIAVLQTNSTTQLADFIRRSVELLALVVAYVVFRKAFSGQPLPEGDRRRMERVSGLTVSAALLVSGALLLGFAVIRMGSFTPTGDVTLGLVIAVLGVAFNGWFWRRYTLLNREQHDTVINSQRNLYQAKTMVDFAVIAGLASVALWPSSPVSGYVDGIGSLLVALYLIWRAIQNTIETQTPRTP